MQADSPTARRAISEAALNGVVSQLAQALCCGAEACDCAERLVAQLGSQTVGTVQPEQCRVGRLVAGQVGTLLFAEHAGIAFDVENVVLPQINSEASAPPFRTATQPPPSPARASGDCAAR